MTEEKKRKIAAIKSKLKNESINWGIFSVILTHGILLELAQ